MKTSAPDFVLSATCFTRLIAARGAVVTFLAGSLIGPLLGAHHLVAGVLLLLPACGVRSALQLAILRSIAPLQPGSFPLDDRNFTLWKLYAMVFHSATAGQLPLTHKAARPPLLLLKLSGSRLGCRCVGICGGCGGPCSRGRE